MSQNADFSADVRIIPHRRGFVKSEIQERPERNRTGEGSAPESNRRPSP